MEPRKTRGNIEKRDNMQNNLAYKNSFAFDTSELIDLISKGAATISDKKIRAKARNWIQGHFDLTEVFNNQDPEYKAFISLRNSVNNVRLKKKEWLRNLRLILKGYNNRSFDQSATKNSSFPVKNREKFFNDRKLHRMIISSSKKLFINNHYSQSIFEACKLLNKKVQELAGSSLDGKQLMLTVFSINDPKLKLNSLQNKSDRDEQEGFMHLFAGLMHGVRNPKGHEIINLKDPYRALEYLGFISLLFRRLDELK